MLPNFLSLCWHTSILYSCLLYLALTRHQCLAGDWLTVLLLSHSILPRPLSLYIWILLLNLPLTFPFTSTLLSQASPQIFPWWFPLNFLRFIFSCQLWEKWETPWRKGVWIRSPGPAPLHLWRTEACKHNAESFHLLSWGRHIFNGKMHFQRAARELGRRIVCPVLWRWSLRWLCNDFSLTGYRMIQCDPEWFGISGTTHCRLGENHCSSAPISPLTWGQGLPAEAQGKPPPQTEPEH